MEQKYKQIWEESLMWVLSHVRSIRLGYGYQYDTGETINKGNVIIEYPKGPLEYKSDKKAIPLNDLENAMLTWSAMGPTGLIMADLGTSTNVGTFMYITGHTIPDPDNVHGLNLIFIKDDGTYIYLPPQAEKSYEINSPSDVDKIVNWYKNYSIKLTDTRTDIAGAQPFAYAFNKNLNLEGTTVFLPAYDASRVIVNILFHIFEYERLPIIDENTGALADANGKIKELIDKGFLNPNLAITMDLFDRAVIAVAGVVVGTAVQNLRLMATAMGLGPWIMGGIIDYALMGAFSPVYKGLAEAGAIICPPPKKSKRLWPYKLGMRKGKQVYAIVEECENSPYREPNELVADFLKIKYGRYKEPNGLEYDGIWSPNRDPNTVPWKPEIYERLRSHPSVKVKDDIKEAVISFITYCVSKYGTFPRIDPFWIPMAVVIHHVDLDFYEKYYRSDMISEKIRNHFEIWH